MHTPFYKEFKHLLGPSVHNLNTICIGLEQIVSGHCIKPQSLSISWNTNDPINDAKRARRYAINLFMVAAVDAIENYTSSIISIENLIPSTIKGRVQSTDGIRDKVKELFQAAKGQKNIKDYWLPSMRLLIAWRNLTVHASKANVVLDLADEKKLRDSANEIRLLHANTNIIETIERFKKKEPPTLKDFSTLFTMLLRGIKEFDLCIGDSINEKTVKELIISQLGNEKFYDFITKNPDDVEKMKKFCKEKSPKEQDDINKMPFNELKVRMINYYGQKAFNQLIADEQNATKRVMQFCLTNSIPYYNIELLKKVCKL